MKMEKVFRRRAEGGRSGIGLPACGKREVLH